MGRACSQRSGRPGGARSRANPLAGLVLFALSVSLTACTSTPSSAPSSTSAPAGSSTTATSGTTTTTLPPTLGSYVPLFPFGTVQDVQSWQESFTSGGSQPWHLDAGQTALAFATWLGFTEIDTVVSVRTDVAGAHVSVGFRTPESVTGVSTAAVVHEVRWGTGNEAPWEVVGTDDTTFSLTDPAYGSEVTSTLTVGGLISGVDENITVQVRTGSSTVGTICCLPAGGQDTPWSTAVSFSAPSGSVLTIAAQTGGHVAGVERFTVTGVRNR